jgi:hypothetical protein
VCKFLFQMTIIPLTSLFMHNLKMAKMKEQIEFFLKKP